MGDESLRQTQLKAPLVIKTDTIWRPQVISKTQCVRTHLGRWVPNSMAIKWKAFKEHSGRISRNLNPHNVH